MPFNDSLPYQPPIDADLTQLTPLHDFVLVREVRGVKPGRASSLIIDPGNIHKTGDHRVLLNRTTGLREGEVVAVGRGDKKPHGGRHPMHVKAGDHVIYPRVPANDILINGEPFTFCHEEQHILAVLED